MRDSGYHQAVSFGVKKRQICKLNVTYNLLRRVKIMYMENKLMSGDDFATTKCILFSVSEVVFPTAAWVQVG